MKVLVTGHRGYIGAAMVPMLQDAGHEVLGLDNYWYGECAFGDFPEDIESLHKDIRDVTVEDLTGLDAIIFLAALSSNALGNLSPEVTHDINHRATMRVAELAKEAGVERFIFSSSCSLYGAQGDELLDEESPFNPVTPYGEAKLAVERDLRELSDNSFSPTIMRNATVYGLSPSMRCDLVVNNLTGYAYTLGEVLLKSDGRAWRPLVHVVDLCSAFLCALEAPRQDVHNNAFNVGCTKENYLIRDVAEIVATEVPGSVVSFSDDVSTELRNYRVDFSKIHDVLPEFKTKWTVRKGIVQLYDAYRAHDLTSEEFLSSRYLRINTVLDLRSQGVLDDELRRKVA